MIIENSVFDYVRYTYQVTCKEWMKKRNDVSNFFRVFHLVEEEEEQDLEISR